MRVVSVKSYRLILYMRIGKLRLLKRDLVYSSYLLVVLVNGLFASRKQNFKFESSHKRHLLSFLRQITMSAIPN